MQDYDPSIMIKRTLNICDIYFINGQSLNDHKIYEKFKIQANKSSSSNDLKAFEFSELFKLKNVLNMS